MPRASQIWLSAKWLQTLNRFGALSLSLFTHTLTQPPPRGAPPSSVCRRREPLPPPLRGCVAAVASGGLRPASAPAARVRRRPTGRSRRRLDPRRGAPQARLCFDARPGRSSIARTTSMGSIWVLGLLLARDRTSSQLQGGASAAAVGTGSAWAFPALPPPTLTRYGILPWTTISCFRSLLKLLLDCTNVSDI